MIEDERQAKSSASSPWNRAEILRLFVAGGGTEGAFSTAFDEIAQQYEREQAAIAAKTFHAGRGSIHYLVSGRKRG